MVTWVPPGVTSEHRQECPWALPDMVQSTTTSPLQKLRVGRSEPQLAYHQALQGYPWDHDNYWWEVVSPALKHMLRYSEEWWNCYTSLEPFSETDYFKILMQYWDWIQSAMHSTHTFWLLFLASWLHFSRNDHKFINTKLNISAIYFLNNQKPTTFYIIIFWWEMVQY